VEAKERSLRQQGAAWTPPSVSASLRDVPIFADISENLFEETILQERCTLLAVHACLYPACCADHHTTCTCAVMLSCLMHDHSDRQVQKDLPVEVQHDIVSV
jgi:hypothetical protein